MFKVTTSQSKTLNTHMGARGPAPLADQSSVPMGALEREARASMESKMSAMRATRDPAEVIGVPTRTTGPLPRLTTTTAQTAKRL